MVFAIITRLPPVNFCSFLPVFLPLDLPPSLKFYTESICSKPAFMLSLQIVTIKWSLTLFTNSSTLNAYRF